MNLKTVVYDEDMPYAKATIGDLANGNCIISCCDGDAMAERDLLAAHMEQDGYDVPEILREG